MTIKPLEKLFIFSGDANRPLANEVAELCGTTLGNAKTTKFSDGELKVSYPESIRSGDVFIVQPTCQPVSDNLMQLLIMIDAAKRASAARVTAVVPYFGYARQDRKDEPRVAITAKLVANLLTTAGVNRILTMDLHAQQIQGFFDIPVDHLYCAYMLAEHFKSKVAGDLVVVSPDAGGVQRARAFAKILQAPLAIIDKRRPQANVAEVMNIIGDVEGRTAILVDDIIDTAGTIVKAAEALTAKGAATVYAACSHGVFSGGAREKIENSALRAVVTTNTIPVVAADKIKPLSIAPELAMSIRKIHEGESLSTMFTQKGTPG